MTTYLVIPYSTNYEQTINALIQAFLNRDAALAYADGFTYVEVVTTTLNN